jgi:hypothetical protein
MNDPSRIGLVNAHTERDSGYDYGRDAGQKVPVRRRPVFCVHPRVVSLNANV